MRGDLMHEQLRPLGRKADTESVHACSCSTTIFAQASSGHTFTIDIINRRVYSIYASMQLVPMCAILKHTTFAVA